MNRPRNENPDALRLLIDRRRKERKGYFDLHRRHVWSRVDEIKREWKAEKPKRAAAKQNDEAKRSRRT